VVDDRVVAFAIVALALLADTSLCRASQLSVGLAEEVLAEGSMRDGAKGA